MGASTRWWRSITHHIVHKIDLYVTVSMAAVVSILGLVGKVSQEKITSVTLAVLALLCLVLIRGRTQGDQIRESLDRIEGLQSLAGRFFSEVDDPAEINDYISTSREIWWHGVTISLHLDTHTQKLRDAIAGGLNVRILVTAPHSAAMEIAANQSGTHSASELGQRLEENIHRLARPIPGGISGRLEVRTVNYVAPYTIFAYDPRGSRGCMVLRLAQFHGRHLRRPTFRLSRERDVEWYDFFLKHFEALWEDGQTYAMLP